MIHWRDSDEGKQTVKSLFFTAAAFVGR